MNPWPLSRLKLFTIPVSMGLANALAELQIKNIHLHYECGKRYGNIVNRLIAIRHHIFTSDAHFGAQNDERKKSVDEEKKNTRIHRI